ncbi:unnamed protein product [Linum tenue]|uniref:Rhodanese domain-containing protein n=1 Tax=Linum tenue TaxID=586396 RepID=A0AAV0LN99_9ROSI|nr:unnamed protein product [Linum tenue]
MAAAAAFAPSLLPRLQITASKGRRLPPSIQKAFRHVLPPLSYYGTTAKAESQPPSLPQQRPPPRSVAVRTAYELLGAGHMYLDVRTSEEFDAGHPTGAVNIPYLLRILSEMSKNPKFLDDVSSKFEKEDEIVIGCQSGRRSLMAAADMQSAGFTRVIDVAGGYISWLENGLPTTIK